MELDLSAALAQIREIGSDVVRLLPNLAIALVAFALFFLVGRWVRRLVRRMNERRGEHHALGMVLGRLAQWAMVLVGLLVAVTILFPSFKPGDLITLLGVSGVAIGFAFKDIFQNFLAGILILLTRPFEVGDEIVVGDFEGRVEEIQTRATLIRTYEGRRVVIPNADLYTDKVTVNTAFQARRSQYDVGIGYGDDVDRAREVVLQAVCGIEGVLADPAPDVLVVALADFSVNLRVRWWSHPQRADVLQVQDRVLAAVKDRLVAEGIDLPFPTQQVLFHDQTEETDGDRSRQREGWPAGRGDVPRSAKVSAALREVAGRAGDVGSADGEPSRDGGGAGRR
ncbi:MAG TPA: mechanosensitive ion channel family protein [Longimicrobiaceae bacterium]|nr:mechanosensitive ion channel family protein [Longimicrobiaceae bacterium]